MVAVIPVAALDEIDVVEGRSLLPLFQPVKEAPPRPAHVLEPPRLVLPVEGQGVGTALEAEQREAQLQPVHPRPAHGGVPGRTENLIFLRPLVGRVIGGQPGADSPAFLHQRPGPLPHTGPDQVSAHGALTTAMSSDELRFLQKFLLDMTITPSLAKGKGLSY